MVRHHIRQLVEPEGRQLREDLALVGDAGAQHVVERRDAIGGDQQQRVAQVVDVAHFAGAKARQRGQVGLDDGHGETARRGSLAKRCMLADAARRWVIVRPTLHAPTPADGHRAARGRRAARAFPAKHRPAGRRRRDGPGPAGPGRGGAGRHRADLRAPRAALAVPAGADWPRAPVGRPQDHDHRVCRHGAAAGARRRIAAPVPAGAQGRAERHGHVCHHHHRAAARHHHGRAAVCVVPAGVRSWRRGGRRRDVPTGEARRRRWSRASACSRWSCCSSWPGIPARSNA